MAQQNFIKERIGAIKSEYPVFRDMQDYHVFTALCLKYFFFGEETFFDPDMIKEMLTDGPKDGGIDAVFNDPNSEGNDMHRKNSAHWLHPTMSNWILIITEMSLEDCGVYIIAKTKNYPMRSVQFAKGKAYKN